MSFLYTLFTTQTTASTLLYLCLAAFSGVIIGKVEIKNIKLGIAGVLFSGLLIAHLGARADAAVIGFARDFGLILFVYSIGLDIGPRFFSTFKNEGLKLNLFVSCFISFKRLKIFQPAALSILQEGCCICLKRL
jgi:putative transport protein